MSVFRIEKTRDYTVMSNHHLKNKALSLKAKGLMSLMLSLPEEWDFSMDGLSRISLEGVDAIRTGLSELEAEGYLETSTAIFLLTLFIRFYTFYTSIFQQQIHNSYWLDTD